MEKVYYICFGVGIVFAIITALTSHLFGGGHGADVGTGGHAEAGYDYPGSPGISAFSPTVIFSFITAFGGIGIVCLQFQSLQSPLVNAPISAAGAFLLAGAVFWLFNTMIRKAQSSSESRVSDLVGHVATIVTPIPAEGVGEIAYVQAGTRYTAPAREVSGQAVGPGRTVTITRVVGTQFYVRTETL